MHLRSIPTATGSLLRGALPCGRSSGLRLGLGDGARAQARPALTLSGGRSNRPLSPARTGSDRAARARAGDLGPLGLPTGPLTSSPFLLQVRESGIPSPRLPPPKVD